MFRGPRLLPISANDMQTIHYSSAHRSERSAAQRRGNWGRRFIAAVRRRQINAVL